MTGAEGTGTARRAGGWLLLGLLAITLTVGWWSKARCVVDGDGWTGGEQYLGWCYSDIYPLWFAEGLDQGKRPYVDHPVEYPVLTGGQMWLADRVMRALPGPPSATGFYQVNALLGAGLLVWTFLSLRAIGLPRDRLLRFVLAPTLVVYAFMNWDPLAVALCVAAVAAHRRDHDLDAGVLAGLGAAAKLFPVFLVPLVVAARWAQGRRRDALTHAGAAAAVWLLVNLPVLLVAPRGWSRFLELNRERPADWDTVWLLLYRLGWWQPHTGTLNLVTAGVFLAGGAALCVLGARRRPPERWWELLLPLLAWFLLANKVYSPQFSLWLIPLMALALPSTAAFVAFSCLDLMVFLTRFPYLGGESGLQPAPGYPLFAAALLLRAAALVWVIASTVRGQPSETQPDAPPRVTAPTSDAPPA